MAEGRAEGMAEGKAEGKKEAISEMIKQLRLNNIPEEQINRMISAMA